MRDMCGDDRRPKKSACTDLCGVQECAAEVVIEVTRWLWV